MSSLRAGICSCLRDLIAKSVSLKIMYHVKSFNCLLHIDGYNTACKLVIAILNFNIKAFPFVLLALTEICIGFKVRTIFTL